MLGPALFGGPAQSDVFSAALGMIETENDGCLWGEKLSKVAAPSHAEDVRRHLTWLLSGCHCALQRSWGAFPIL